MVCCQEVSRMSVAYVILAHASPNHFARLKNALLEQNCARLFVHVDAKSEIGPFRAAAPEARVSFIEGRVDVAWGDFSIVQATLALIDAALSDREVFSRICLVSGADYPIRSAEHISNFFYTHRNVEFMNLVRMPADHLGKPLSRLTRYRLSPRRLGSLTKYAQRIIDRVVVRDYQRHLGGMEPFAGSQWWALTPEACEYVLAFASSRGEFVRFFRHVLVPDESFFQTIIGNSPFASRASRNLTKTWWNSGAASPSILDREKVLLLTGTEPLILEDSYGSGEILFARKFPDDSAALVQLLNV